MQLGTMLWSIHHHHLRHLHRPLPAGLRVQCLVPVPQGRVATVPELRVQVVTCLDRAVTCLDLARRDQAVMVPELRVRGATCLDRVRRDQEVHTVLHQEGCTV
jgi:hypothetical protein